MRLVLVCYLPIQPSMNLNSNSSGMYMSAGKVVWEAIVGHGRLTLFAERGVLKVDVSCGNDGDTTLNGLNGNGADCFSTLDLLARYRV